MKHQLKTLENNLKTLFIESRGSTAATVQIWFRAGSALEQKENQGIAHFLEHMFFKGTKKRPGAAIAHAVESFGGEINAFTSFDYTCYYINTPVNKLLESVDILMDMVANPIFLEEDLIPEREVVFEEYRRSLDSPNQYSFFKIQNQSFPKSYNHPILGSEDTIKHFTLEQLKEFRNNFYNTQNALLVVAGDFSDNLSNNLSDNLSGNFSGEFSKQKFENKINEFKLPSGKKSVFPIFSLKKESSCDAHNRDVRMGQITIVCEASDYNNEDAAAEDIALNCLGHGETSKLYSELVLNGSLANSASTSSLFMAHGGVHFLRYSFPINNFKKSLIRLENIIIDVCKNGFNKRDIQKIKNQYISSKIFEMETIESYAFSLGHGFAQNEDIESEEKFIEKVKNLSHKKINNAIENILKRPLHFSLQLPQKEDCTKFEKELKIFSDSLSKKIHTISTDHNKKTKKIKVPSGVTLSQYDPQVKLTTIAPGIKFLYRHNPISPTFVMHAYIKGGLGHENSKTNGAYHLISGLLTKGYVKGYGKDYEKINSEKIRLELEERSATLHGFAGKNAYGLNCHGLACDMQILTNHFIGSLLYPTFEVKHLSHEKKLTLRQLENQQEDPMRICFQMVSELMFGQHPYAQNSLGTPTSIKNLTQKNLLTIHQKSIKNQEILISYCGIDEEQQILELLNPLFSHFKKNRIINETPKNKITPRRGITQLLKFDREQTHIFYGIPLKGMKSLEHIYLKMMTAHLSGQSSELFVEVRDRQGLCYSAGPVHFQALDAGYFGIYMASGHDKVQKALEAIKKIMEEHQNNGLSKIQFERLKIMIEGQNLLSVQTNDDYLGVYSVPVLQGSGIDYYHRNNKIIKELNYEDFQKNIKKILKTNWNTVIVGR